MASLDGALAVDWVRLESLAASSDHLARAACELQRQRALERTLMASSSGFSVPGYCWVCRSRVDFRVDYSYAYAVDGVLTPNWREHLLCPGCRLNNRMRATVHFLEERLAPARGAAIYLTEQTTPLFGCLSERYPRLVGSEYLGQDVPFGGQTASGIRNESVVRLSFADASFDCLITLEVLEHVPAFERALAECQRVLRPGATLLFSVPFRPECQRTLVRALVDEQDRVQHLLPPEYHGDPLRSQGCLAFYSFGWELLDQVRAAGFAEVHGYRFWSRDFGYLGSQLMLFLATRQGA